MEDMDLYTTCCLCPSTRRTIAPPILLEWHIFNFLELHKITEFSGYIQKMTPRSKKFHFFPYWRFLSLSTFKKKRTFYPLFQKWLICPNCFIYYTRGFLTTFKKKKTFFSIVILSFRLSKRDWLPHLCTTKTTRDPAVSSLSLQFHFKTTWVVFLLVPPTAATTTMKKRRRRQ